MTSIAAMIADFGDRARIGAGTVLRVAEVAAVAALGGRLIVSPNCTPEVIRATRAAARVDGDTLAIAPATADALRLREGDLIRMSA